MARINFATEKDMVDIYLEVNEVYLSYATSYHRELTIGDYGRIDLLFIDDCSDNKCRMTILEFKNRFFEMSDISQICRYKKGIIEYFKKYLPNINLVIKMEIVCTGINEHTDQAYLTDTIKGLSITVAEINSCGVTFEECSGYSLTNPNFKQLQMFDNNWDTLGHVPKEPDISASASLSDSELKETIKKD